MPARSMQTVMGLRIPPLEDAAVRSSAHTGRDGYIGVCTYAEPSVNGTLQFSRVAWLGVGCVRAGAHRVVHDPSQDTKPTATATHLLLQVGGTSVLGHNGRSLTLERGHWTALRSDRTYTIYAPGHTERIMILIPDKGLTLDLTPSATRSYSAISGASRLLYSVATSLAGQLGEIRAVDAPALARHLGGLIRVALGAAISGDVCEDEDERQQMLRRYIARHLRDPDLTRNRIALDLGCTTRTLARMFEGRGETLMNQIYRARLEGARSDLCNSSLDARPLADIARFWGFRNYTHFSDRFHTYFGLTPAAARMQATMARVTGGAI
jgi:AraC-like DNA-binding protein